MGKTAAILVNYNMPERADAIAEKLSQCRDCDLYLVDNGSDIMPEARHTNVRLLRNVQTTRGWLDGLEVAKAKGEYDYYWFWITSAEYVEDGDILEPLIWEMEHNEAMVAIHPALTTDSTTTWLHMITRGSGRPRRTWMVDNIASLYRAQWYDQIGGFDPRLYMAHGIDLETCYIARKQSRSIYVHDGVLVRKVSNIGYTLGRMNATAQDRLKAAAANMDEVLGERYGAGYWRRLMTEYVTGEML